MSISLNANALLASYTELNNFTQASFTDSDYTNILINYASDLIQKITKRNLIATDYTSEVYSGNGRLKLFLKNYPINSITYLYEWDTISDTATVTHTVNTDYFYDSKQGWIYLRAGFVRDVHNYQITYNAGYKLTATEGYTTLPYDIRKACADLCMFMHSQKDKIGFKSEKIGDYSYSLNSATPGSSGFAGIPPEIMVMIEPYMRMGDIF